MISLKNTIEQIDEVLLEQEGGVATSTAVGGFVGRKGQDIDQILWVLFILNGMIWKKL